MNSKSNNSFLYISERLKDNEIAKKLSDPRGIA